MCLQVNSGALQVTVFFSACNAMPVNELMYRIVTSVIAFGYVWGSVGQTGICR